jgi:glycine C-acetyltransferase
VENFPTKKIIFIKREICDLADKYECLVFIDECHATGFFGATGRGTEEYLNLAKNRVDIVNSTLGKALGGAAGTVTSPCQKYLTYRLINLDS